MTHRVLTRAAIVLATGMGALGHRSAEACGAISPPYVTLTEALPLSRTGVPRDGAVIIRGQFWGPAGGPSEFATVRLSDEAGNPIPARSLGWSGAGPALAYAWTSPLPAGAKVTVEAMVPAGAAKPAGAEGPTAATFVLEIGEHLAEPLVLAGPLRVQLEAFDADVLSCEGLCGNTTCTKVGERRALRARIRVPAATGGVDFDGYRGMLRFTDDHPVTFDGPGEGQRLPGNVNLMHWIGVRSGEETEVVQEIFDEASPFAPCFALNLWDPAGHAVQPEPVCLPSIKASEHVRALDGDPAGGCSTVPGRGEGAWPFWVLISALALGTRSSGPAIRGGRR